MGRLWIVGIIAGVLCGCPGEDDDGPVDTGPRDAGARDTGPRADTGYQLQLKTGPVVNIGSVGTLDAGSLDEVLRRALMRQDASTITPEIGRLLADGGTDAGPSPLDGIRDTILKRISANPRGGYTHRRINLEFFTQQNAVLKCISLVNIEAFAPATPTMMLQNHEDQHARISNEVLMGVADKCCRKEALASTDRNRVLTRTINAITAAITAANDAFDQATNSGQRGAADQRTEADAAISDAIAAACN